MDPPYSLARRPRRSGVQLFRGFETRGQRRWRAGQVLDGSTRSEGKEDDAGHELQVKVAVGVLTWVGLTSDTATRTRTSPAPCSGRRTSTTRSTSRAVPVRS